jgi:hypothetical protein
VHQTPECRERHDEEGEPVAERATVRAHDSSRERRSRDQCPGDQARDDAGPCFCARQFLLGDRRREAERHRRSGRDEEAQAEQEVEPSPLGCETGSGEQRDETAGQRARRLQNEPEVRQLIARMELRMREEERERRTQEGEEEALAEQPSLIGIAIAPHLVRCRHEWGNL